MKRGAKPQAAFDETRRLRLRAFLGRFVLVAQVLLSVSFTY
jgi:hypothetical protein